jgi:septum formation protein
MTLRDSTQGFRPESGPHRLVLASGSASRARMLAAAGVDFLRAPADLDEAALMPAEGDAAAAALALAGLKALSVSEHHAGALVLGGDSILEFLDEKSGAGEHIGKAPDVAAAKALLMRLSGKTHRIVSGAVLAKDGKIVWRHVDAGRLAMRPLGEAFLDAYLAAEAPAILASVGCYHLEGRGAQLFDRIEGDFFSILGLPLLPVLAALREQGILPS